MKIRVGQIVLLSSFLCFVNIALAQDDILFLNGKSKHGKFLEADSLFVRFETNKKGKKKVRDFEKEKVFSVQLKSGDKLYVYEPDSFETEILTIGEMELFVLGQQEARRGFKAPIAFIEGFFCGVLSGYFVNSYLSSFYAPLPILANSILVGKYKTKVNIEQVLNPNYFQKETYLAGYREQAGFKKMQSVTIGSLLGLATGFVISYAVPVP